jgi:membrane fusion protein (multidrug efflux system)
MSALQTDTSQYAAGLRATGGVRWGPVERLRTDRAFLRRVLMIGGVVLVIAVSLALWLTGGRYVGTDDSYVHAAQLNVSTDV